MSPSQPNSTDTYRIMAPGGAGGGDTRRPPGVVSPVRKAWIEWLDAYPWQIIGTFTFAQPCLDLEHHPNSRRHRRVLRKVPLARVASGQKYLLDRLARSVFPRAQADPERLLYVLAHEQHQSGELHLHFLGAAPPDRPPLLPLAATKPWVGWNPERPKIGFAEVQVFNPTMAHRAFLYITKTAADGGDIIVSKALRRGGA